MLGNIKGELDKPLSRRAIVLAIIILVMACLAMVGILYRRYEFEISRESPVFTPPTPFELLQSKAANNAARIEELGKNLNNLNKEVEEIKKNQEAQEESSRSFLFIDPTTNSKIYVNREYGFQIGVPYEWYYIGSFYTTDEEKARQQRVYPDKKNIDLSSVSFSNEKITNPIHLGGGGLYLSISIYEYPEDIDLKSWVAGNFSNRIAVSESEVKFLGQKALLRTFDTFSSVSIDGGDAVYGKEIYFKNGKNFFTLGATSRNREGWQNSHGEDVFWKIVETFRFLD